MLTSALQRSITLYDTIQEDAGRIREILSTVTQSVPQNRTQIAVSSYARQDSNLQPSVPKRDEAVRIGCG